MAQEEQGTITGIVRDVSGAVNPNAAIICTNAATGAVNKTASDGDGYFSIPYLSPGDYDVSAGSQGFARSTVTGIHLTVNPTANVQVTLEPGSVTQQASVQANAIQLETETSELGGTVSRQQIIELPQLGRNPYNLLALEPGVLPLCFNARIQAEVNGGEASTSTILLDGATQVNSSSGDPAFTPPLESVGQLKLITNNYSAEYGMSGGGVVTAASETGTNNFHGSAYEYLRNTDFNANGWHPNHVGQQRSPYHENKYGFSIGGPVRVPRVYNGKDKTFFFMNLEWDPQRTPDLITASVPTAAMRGGIFSGLVDESGHPITLYDPATITLVPGTTNTFSRRPLPNNIIPAARLTSPIVQNILNSYPLPNTYGIQGIYNNFVLTPTRSTSQDTLLARVDQNFGSRNKPDGGVTDGTFGQITSSGHARNPQIGGRLSF